MNLASIPIRNPRVSARVINGAALVVVLDRREVHRLNRVGARIWELCDGRTLSDIKACIEAEYEAPKAAVESDLQTFVRELGQLGALSLSDPDGGASNPAPDGTPGATPGEGRP